MKRLLVVDDERAIREAVEEVLSAEGYAVSLATNGAEALQRASEVRPDLVLLDLMMPGMDGWEMLRRMRAAPGLAQVPVLLMSAGRVCRSELQGLPFLAKPFSLDVLLERVAQELGRPHA